MFVCAHDLRYSRQEIRDEVRRLFPNKESWRNFEAILSDTVVAYGGGECDTESRDLNTLLTTPPIVYLRSDIDTVGYPDIDDDEFHEYTDLLLYGRWLSEQDLAYIK